MNFLKRAQASVKRKPGKSIILLALVFILGAVIAGAVSIQQAVHNTEANLRRALPPVVTISQDTNWELQEQLMNEGYAWQELMLTPDMMQQISKLPQVVDFDYNLTAGILAVDDLVQVETNADMWGGMEQQDFFLQLFGVSNPEILQVNQGLIDMVEGRAFTQAEIDVLGETLPIVVSREFANTNGLNVGSTIETVIRQFPVDFDSPFWTEPDPDAEPAFEQFFQFTVVGLFEIGPNGVTAEDENDWNGMNQEFTALNRVYVPNNVIAEIIRVQDESWRQMMEDQGQDTTDWEESTPWFENIFVLEDLGEVEAFRASVMEIVPPIWRVQDLSSTFAQISGSMDTMLFIANIVLWVAIGATLIILSLLITLFLRDRKHEIGIYLALGERKGNIIAQILLEVLSVSIVGILLSLFAGNLISDGISRQMIQNNMMNAQNDGMFWDWNPLEGMGFSTSNMTMDEMLESYEVSLDGRTIALFFLVGTGTVILSTAIPIIYVTSINPKKILM